MEQEEASASPAALSPRTKARKATRKWKDDYKERDLVGYRAMRAEQEKNRVHKKMEREAAKAAFEAEGCVVPMSLPFSNAAATANMPISTIAWTGSATCEPRTVPPQTGDATTPLALPFGLTPPPPSPFPPPLLPPFSPPFLPCAPLSLAPPAPAPPLPMKDGCAFEKKKIKELEGKVKDLEAAVRTRDRELDGFAESLHAAVQAAMKVRDNKWDKPKTARSTYDTSIPFCVNMIEHKPDDSQCLCACCFALSFFALPLAQRAVYLKRKRAEDA